MGNSIIKQQGKATIPPLLDETQIFTLWSISDVRELWKRFQSQIYGFALVEAQFESIISFKENVAKHVNLEDLFDILDNDHDGRIDGLELLGGLTLCCKATFDEKARFCFELFDFNLNACMSKKELIIMMMSSVCGLNIMTGGGEELEPDIDVFEALADDAIKRADLNSDGQISFEEFLYWARTNRELMAGLETLNKIASDAKEDIDTEDSAPETDDGDLSDLAEWTPDSPSKQLLRGTKAAQKGNDDASSLPSKSLVLSSVAGGDESMASCQWLGQINEPTNFKDRKRSDDGPDTNLELAWAFGYRAQVSRNNLRYVGSTDSNPCQVVFYTAALGVVYHLASRTQMFYMGHTDEITSLAMHPSQLIVATADIKSNIHIWNTESTGGAGTSFAALSILRGVGKDGIQHMVFAPQGDRIVSVGMDADHTVTVYDIGSGSVISSAKGLSSPNTVFDLAYSSSGAEVALVGKNQVKFFKGVNTNKRALESHIGKIGNTGKRQAFLCVTYYKEDAIVGCGSGELYRFKDHQLVQIVQAHGVREPILSLFFNKTDGTLLSGGKDGLVKTWDSTLVEVGAAIDLSEDVDGDGRADNGSLDCAIISLQQSGDRILLGTRGSDMFEARLPPTPAEHHVLTRIGWGHASGELWGLCMHPTRGEFATCGGDKTMRIWSIRSHEQINMRQLPCDARTLCYSPSGDVLCVGMTDGSTALIDTTTSALRVYSTWKHCCKAVTDIKFSPNGRILAVGAADCNIYLYKSEDTKAFVRQAVCKGHSGAVTHLDFSSDSQNIQSNGADYALLFWDTEGNQIKSSSALRDTVWATFTCTLGWPVQGIWPTVGCDYSEVNACMALEDLGDIVTGDDAHRVNLYRYPAVKHGALHQSYVGHASHVTNVSFSFNRRFVATLGGLDRTILLWKHKLEVADSDSELEAGYSSASSAVSVGRPSGPRVDVETKHEIADVGPRSAAQEAINLGWSAQEMKDFVGFYKSGRDQFKGDRKKVVKDVNLSAQPTQGDESVSVKPWRSAIAEPTHWKPTSGCTDVDLSLQWVHGFRSFDCRNNVLYSAAGYIVYNTAALAVVYNKAAGKQQFLQGAHVDEVVGIAAHPAGQIFATGEAGSRPSIVIWNSKDMQVLSKIEGAHERGVPLLAFSNRGNILASVGLDADCSLSIHDWSKGIQILRTATDKGKVLCMCFLANDSSTDVSVDAANSVSDVVATGGEKHLKFWWSQGQNVQSQRALWGTEKKHTVLSIASTNKDMCVTGSSRGVLLIWKDFKMVSRVGSQSKDSAAHDSPHSSALTAMWAIRGQVDVVDLLHDPRGSLDGYYQASRYLTGDKDGVVCIWRLVEVEAELGRAMRLILMKTFNITQLLPKTVDAEVRSLCERDGVILVGTRGSEIYEVSENTLPFITRANPTVSKVDSKDNLAELSSLQPKLSIPSHRLGSGHFSGEVWGLAMHPFLPVFVTSGDDCAVRCWHLPTNKLLSYFMLPEKCRAVDIKPFDGEDLAMGLNSGATWVVKMTALMNPNRSKEAVDSRLDGAELLLDEVRQSVFSTTSDLPSALNSRKSIVSVVPRLQVVELLQGPTQWSQVVKYSFEGSLLAAGSYDGTIYLYHVKQNYGSIVKLVGHAGIVTHLDFGLLLRSPGAPPTSTSVAQSTTDKNNQVYTDVFVVERVSDDQQSIVVKTTQLDVTVAIIGGAVVSRSESVLHEVMRDILPTDICIQSTSADFDLLFWRGDGSKITSASSLKDAWWASFSCPLGWSVQGIWSEDPGDCTEINAVARSHTWDKVPVLACVDGYGRLRLYNYPCVLPGASDKCYKGHSSNVRNIAFSCDDTFCVTVGGGDKGVFVWATDIQDEIRERAAYDAAARTGGVVVEYLDVTATDLATAGGVRDGEAADEEVSYSIFKSVPTGGDEAGAVKPWKGAIREPFDWKEPPELGQQPDANLELKFVYGYRGWDCRNNVSFADSRFEVVYHIAGAGVVFDTRQQSQIHNTDHDEDILCLAVHPEGHMVATGEIGKLPKIVLWDANTGVTIRTIMYHKRGVANIAFSQDGSMLVSTGMDDERTVVVHNVQTGAVLGKGKAGKGVEVYSVTVGGGNTMFITGGKNHVKFWELPKVNSPGGELSSKAGIYNIKSVKARTVVSTAFLGVDAVTGMQDGSILLWKDRSNTKVCQAHTGAVTAMCGISDSGSGGGGTIDSRENGPRVISGGKDGFVHIWDLQLNKVWSLNMNETSPLSAYPQVQALATKENRLLIGTKASEIYEVNMLNAAEAYRLVQGHFDERAEVWGLATHPSSHKFVTCGDDMTVRLWDGKTMQQIEMVHLDTKARAVAFRPDGSQIAVATFDGKVHILSSNLQSVVATLTVASSWVQALTYSPDGGLLGVGSHDDFIYLLETKSYSCKYKFKGHHSFITALDFSVDGSRLQSASGDYELLFWDCNTGRQVLSATGMRDIKWATFTCTLGWPVQGIWPPGADGTDVNSVDRSPCGRYLASGDDFRRVKLFRYPCPKEKSKHREYKGHAEHVINVRFGFDSKYVYSVGGLDKAVMQFEVKPMSITSGSSKLK